MPHTGTVEILLVEDDEVDIQSISRALKKIDMPFNLHIARNGIEAIDLLCGSGGQKKLEVLPHLVILDINMPMMNGIEFLKKVRGDPELGAMNVVILTTSNADKDKIDALNLNVAGYFVKPFHTDDFLSLCKIILI